MGFLRKRKEQANERKEFLMVIDRALQQTNTGVIVEGKVKKGMAAPCDFVLVDTKDGGKQSVIGAICSPKTMQPQEYAKKGEVVLVMLTSMKIEEIKPGARVYANLAYFE